MNEPIDRNDTEYGRTVNRRVQTMAGIREVWDPFAGTRPFERPRVEQPGKGIKLPSWNNTLRSLLATAATITLVVAFFWWPAGGPVHLACGKTL